MGSIQLTSMQGQVFDVALPVPRSGQKSGYAFAFAKSGSTLLNNLIVTYCTSCDIPTFSLFDSAFANGVPTHQIGDDAMACFAPSGVIYTGFRHYPRFDLDLDDCNVLLLVRDPRDMLVSMYFSVARSHVIPKRHERLKRERAKAASLTIDEFVLSRASIFSRIHAVYQKKLPLERIKVYRYEDVVFEKRAWLADIVASLDLPVDRDLIDMVVERFDIVPQTEDDREHIRQVYPGDHRVKLEQATIERLNEQLAGFLSSYDYR